ncbi:hypothetical protein GCM10010304_80200 [Streptomyces roseoviolaceus]
MQVKDLQPDPDKVVRIVTKRGHVGTGVRYLDGIVRNVWRGDGGDEDYGVVLYRPAYRQRGDLLRQRERRGDRGDPDGGTREH